MSPKYSYIFVALLLTTQSAGFADAMGEAQKVINISPGSYESARHRALTNSSVIPDVLKDFQPGYDLHIAYTEAHLSVDLGNILPVDAVSSRPVIEFFPPSTSFNPSSGQKLRHEKYTLVLTDPDATSRDDPKWSEMCHWIVTNITMAGIDGAPSIGHELVEYLPPAPPPGTGKHRYVFVLLKSNKNHQLQPPTMRKHWGYGTAWEGVQRWANENSLSIVSADFFYAENEGK